MSLTHLLYIEGLNWKKQKYLLTIMDSEVHLVLLNAVYLAFWPEFNTNYEKLNDPNLWK